MFLPPREAPQVPPTGKTCGGECGKVALLGCKHYSYLHMNPIQIVDNLLLYNQISIA
jgi:hypothetical protein